MESKYKLGQSVLFINGYGITSNEQFMWKYGEVVAGFVTSIEYIEAHKGYLYTVGRTSPLSSKQVVYRMLGEHMIFFLDEESKAVLKMSELCEEPDYD